MVASLAADLLVLLHLAFILFVVLGGLLVLRWPRLAWAHLPAAAWGVFIEFSGWLCPITPLENAFRHAAGQNGYSGGFIDHYILPLIYPPGLTRDIQIVLGIAVVTINAAAYAALAYQRYRRREQGERNRP